MDLLKAQERNRMLHNRLETMLNEISDSVDIDEIQGKLQVNEISDSVHIDEIQGKLQVNFD